MNNLKYIKEVKNNTYIYDTVKRYNSNDASIEELQGFSDIVNFDRSMPAMETLEEWEKYHNYFNK